MNNLLLFLAEFAERLATSLREAADSGNLSELLELWPLFVGFLWFFYAGLRHLYRLVRRLDTKAREDKREAERNCKIAQDQLEETEARVDELRKYDPNLFLAKPQSAEAAEAYLAPLRPALEKAYCDIAEEQLIEARDEVGAEQVLVTLRAARGAVRDSKRADELREAASRYALLLASEDMAPEIKAAFDLADKNGDHSGLATVGKICSLNGHYRAADIFLRRAYQLVRKDFGERTPQTVAAGRNLAAHLHISSQEYSLRDAFGSWLGFDLEEFPEQTRFDVANVQRWVAAAMSHFLMLEDAQAVYKKINEAVDRGVLEYSGLSAAIFAAEQGQQAQFVGDYAAALAHYEVAWSVYPGLREHQNWAMLESWQAIALLEQGETAKAEAAFESCYDFFVTSDRFGPGHPQTMLVLMDWMKARVRSGNFEAALPQARKAYDYFLRDSDLGASPMWLLMSGFCLVAATGNSESPEMAKEIWDQIMAGDRGTLAKRNIDAHPEPRLFASLAYMSMDETDMARRLLAGVSEMLPPEILPDHIFRTMLAQLEAELADRARPTPDDIPAQIS